MPRLPARPLPRVIAFALRCAVAALPAAPAAASPVELQGGVGAGAQAAGLGPAAWGRVVVPARGWGLEATVREGIAGRDPAALSGWTSSGALCFGARAGRGPWVVRGGFAHQHDLSVDQAGAAPLQAALGTAPGIRHRSGVELGAALEGRVPGAGSWGWTVGAAGAWLQGASGGGAALWAEAGLRWSPPAAGGAPG